MNLLVDMGNTRLKWALSENGQLMPGETLLNQMLNGKELAALWATLKTPQVVVIASVGAVLRLALVKAVAQELWPGIKIVVASAKSQEYGVTNAYLLPEKLGVDRWLALIAARRRFVGPLCLVDCGTAITIDLLGADGVHQGGFISPGLALMKCALNQGTAALPNAVEHFATTPADSTEAAIFAGTLFSAVGLIENVMAKQTETKQLILTGGDAELIAGQLRLDFTIAEHLVLEGLAMVAEVGR